ncbi:MAG TPA: TetR/AcrR family transcriptional regulator [Acidimicrobiales bacterium]|nr:TetR/AcrR family transcriptional regulator [Acidimicrobiales bacterium]
MPTAGGARARARAEISAEIRAAARRQLAELGPAGLSLRAVARELGMVSSALYRYVTSRDELLTALIVESYDSLGEAAEERARATAGEAPRRRWVELARAVRGWAIEHPNEYALLYGTPVAGYAAPEATNVPGTRVSLALVGVVRDAATAGRLVPRPPLALSGALRQDLARLGELLVLDLDESTLVRMVAAWTQLFGLVSFELFGQTRGVVAAHEELLLACAAAQADAIGLSG